MSKETPRSVLKSVGGWTLGPTLGRGGFGHVRQATHLGTGRMTACKILPAMDSSCSGWKFTKDTVMDAMEAQKEEILLKVMAGLQIEGVVGLDLVRQEKQWKYLFLPMLPKSASQLPLPRPSSEVIPFFRQLLCSLHSLHSIGIWHEDLKPANILMTSEGKPVLADFGLTTFSPGFMKMNGGGGTLDYMSPEKIENYPYDGAAADVYACGILLYKFLTNGHPFINKHSRKDDNDEEIEARILHGEAEWLLQDLPGSSGELVRKMTRRDPMRRWTIPQILNHPYMVRQTSVDALAPRIDIKLPQHTDQPILNPEPSIMFEINMLSYMARQWFPCETDQRLREKLADGYVRWEKRMYHAINAWKAKDPDADRRAQAGNKPMMKALLRVMSETTISDKGPTPVQNQTSTLPKIGSPLKAQKLDFPRIAPKTATIPIFALTPAEKLEKAKLGVQKQMERRKERLEDKENMVRVAMGAAVLAEKEKDLKAGKEEEKGTKRVVMAEKNGTEDNKIVSKTNALRDAKINLQAAMNKVDENEVIDLLSDTEEDEEIVVAPRKKVVMKQTKTKVARKVKAKAIMVEDVDDEEEFLPEPLPKVRHAPRRSPRLQGMAPEHDALVREPRARRAARLAC